MIVLGSPKLPSRMLHVRFPLLSDQLVVSVNTIPNLLLMPIVPFCIVSLSIYAVLPVQRHTYFVNVSYASFIANISMSINVIHCNQIFVLK